MSTTTDLWVQIGKVKIVDYVTATVFDMARAFSSSKHDRTLLCSMHTCGVCARLAPNFSSRPEGGRARKKDGANFCDSENLRFCRYHSLRHRSTTRLRERGEELGRGLLARIASESVWHVTINVASNRKVGEPPPLHVDATSDTSDTTSPVRRRKNGNV